MYVSNGEKEEAGQELLIDRCRMAGSKGSNMKDSPPSCLEQRFRSVPTTERAQNGRPQDQDTIQDTCVGVFSWLIKRNNKTIKFISWNAHGPLVDYPQERRALTIGKQNVTNVVAFCCKRSTFSFCWRSLTSVCRVSLAVWAASVFWFSMASCRLKALLFSRSCFSKFWKQRMFQ